MGHAHITNISTKFVDLLRERGTLTLREAVTALRRAKETVHASTGDIPDTYMLSMACIEVVAFLLEPHGTTERTPDRHKTPVIEPVELTKKQETLLKQFCDGETNGWGCGKSGRGGEYGAFDRISWKLSKKWAKKHRNRIPLLRHWET